MVVPVVEQKRAVSRLKDIGGYIAFDFAYESAGKTDQKGKPPPEPIRAAKVLGIDSVHNVVQVSLGRKNDLHRRLAPLGYLARLRNLNISDCRGLDGNDLEFIAKLTQLQELSLCDDELDDVSVPNLQNLNQLKHAWLYQNRIADDGLASFANLTNLEKLVLFENQITGEGLKYFAKLANLKELYLSENQIADEGLQHLANLTKLESLWLGKNQITGSGLEYLSPMATAGGY